MSRGRHSAPSWWERRVCGTWTQNKLLSRKWWLVIATVGGIIALDTLGRALQSTTLHVLEIIVPAYLVVEGALDWRYKRKAYKQSQYEDNYTYNQNPYRPYDGGDV